MKHTKFRYGLRKRRHIKKYDALMNKTKRFYYKYRSIIKTIVWPILLSVIIFYTCKSDDKIRKIVYINELLLYFEGLLFFLIDMLDELKWVLLTYFTLYIFSKFLSTKGAMFPVLVLRFGIFCFCVLMFVLALLSYIATLNEVTLTIFPIYYSITIVGYNWMEYIFKELLLEKRRKNNGKISIRR